jgi:hypothetical protein
MHFLHVPLGNGYGILDSSVTQTAGGEVYRFYSIEKGGNNTTNYFDFSLST